MTVDVCSIFVPNQGMERIERSRLFHRLAGTLSFNKRQIGAQLSHAQIYTICDLICDDICTESVMVVAASMSGFTHAVTGTFGKDEPWPEWCDPHGLKRDFAKELPPSEELALESKASTV